MIPLINETVDVIFYGIIHTEITKLADVLNFKDKLDPVLILALRAPKQILVINKMKILGSDPQAPTRVLFKYPRVPPSRPLLGGGELCAVLGVCLK